MNVVSIWRSRSGLAWASCSCRKRAGSILLGAVIAFFFWVSVEGHPEDHAVAASTFRARYSPGPSYTTLADATPPPRFVVRALAETALTGPLQVTTTHRRSSGPSLTGGYVVRPAQPVLRPPPTPFRQAVHFPRSSVIGRHAPTTTFPQVVGPGRASPVPAATEVF